MFAPKILHRLSLHFSLQWENCNIQEKFKTKVLHFYLDGGEEGRGGEWGANTMYFGRCANGKLTQVLKRMTVFFREPAVRLNFKRDHGSKSSAL